MFPSLPDSLDVLAKEVLEKFSVVQNRNLPPPLFPGNPLTEKELQVQTLTTQLLWKNSR